MRHIFGSSGSESRDSTYTWLVHLNTCVSVMYYIHMGNSMSLDISFPYIGTHISYRCLIILWCSPHSFFLFRTYEHPFLIILEVTILNILRFLNRYLWVALTTTVLRTVLIILALIFLWNYWNFEKKEIPVFYK